MPAASKPKKAPLKARTTPAKVAPKEKKAAPPRAAPVKPASKEAPPAPPRTPPPKITPKEEAAPAPRPVPLSDTAADMGDTFEEALLERLAQEDGRGWRAGPVVALPMDRLEAGHLGWMTTLSAPGIFTLGTIHLLVLPGDGRTAPAELPLLDAEWDQFDSVEHYAGPPRLLLLAHARDPVKKPDVRQLAHDVFERLKAELGPDRRPRSARS